MTNNSFIIKTSQIKTMKKKKLLLPLRNVSKNKRNRFSYLIKFINGAYFNMTKLKINERNSRHINTKYV